MKVGLVGSSGGHLTHLYMLKQFWKDKERFWVTFDKEDARSVLEGEKVYPCYYPTNRNIKNLVKNTIVAIKVLVKEKPDLLISSGAAVAVPFLYIAKIMGKKLILFNTFYFNISHSICLFFSVLFHIHYFIIAQCYYITLDYSLHFLHLINSCQ